MERTSKFNALVGLILLLCLSLCGLSVGAKPNILVVVADDLGYGDLASTGHPHIQTPNLDRLAASGKLMTQFYSAASVCSPSRAAMMTGRLPYRTGIYGFIHVGAPYVHLPRSERTIPQLLQDAGYQTALFGKWHISLNDFRKKIPGIPSMKHYGFDHWFSSDNNTVIRDKPGWWKNGKSLGKLEGCAADVVGKESSEWIERGREKTKPFAAFVHFYEPHWLIEAPDELVAHYHPAITKNRSEAIYAASIENVDRNIGIILGALQKAGLRDDTFVLFTSDHGPAHLGKDRAHNRNYGTAAPYRGKKYGLWDGSVHVPGIISWPAKLDPGTISTPCGLIDLLPTLCALGRNKLPESLDLDGVNFLPALSGKLILRPKPLQWHHYNSTLHRSPNPNASIREDNWIISGFYDVKTEFPGRWWPKHMEFIRSRPLKRFELHHLKKDPAQGVDLARQEPARFIKMRDTLIKAHRTAQRHAVGWSNNKPVPPPGQKTNDPRTSQPR